MTDRTSSKINKNILLTLSGQNNNSKYGANWRPDY